MHLLAARAYVRFWNLSSQTVSRDELSGSSQKRQTLVRNPGWVNWYLAMRIKQNVIYVFSETGRNDLVKIGTCSKGGWERFREGAFMNPRGLDAVSLWLMPDTETSRKMERNAHKLFRKLENADGKEWFCAKRDHAISQISELFEREPDYTASDMPFSTSELYYSDKYDELSERGDCYKGRLVRRRIWLHEELGGEFRKISQNTWWCEPGSRSTNAKRTTYNTRRMRPVVCLALPVDDCAPNWEALAAQANERTLSIWEAVVAERGASDRPAGRVGWTVDSLEQLVNAFKIEGFMQIPMDMDNLPRGIKSLNFPDR